MSLRALSIVTVTVVLLWSGSASAVPFFFSTGDVNGQIATASRPSSPGKIEIETADDFVVSGGTLKLTSATFQGLIPTGSSLSNIGTVRVEIYRVFPADSDVGRTSGPPTFSTSQVPTRVNSPSDVALDSRESGGGGLTFTPGIVQSNFTAANSIVNGIHPLPNVVTGGEGAVTGQQVQFNVLFSTPFSLPADHYFFVPQVELASGDFFWLSSVRPIVSPGTPFRGHGPPELDTQREPGPGLVADRHGHCRGHHLQCRVHARRRLVGGAGTCHPFADGHLDGGCWTGRPAETAEARLAISTAILVTRERRDPLGARCLFEDCSLASPGR